MGVESYCVKFYLVHDLWRAWCWQGKETRMRCLDHGGAGVWLYLGVFVKLESGSARLSVDFPHALGSLRHPTEENTSLCIIGFRFIHLIKTDSNVFLFVA